MSDKAKTKVIGIDGCKAGWCVAISYDGNYFIEIHTCLNAVFTTHPNFAWCLIDMPIGLPAKSETRNVESAARKELSPGFTSSIFTPPCYEVLSASNYLRAKQINLQITGKSLSIQSWNLVPKIRELEQFLNQNPAWQSKIVESHPEINFKRLNNGKLLKHKKAAKEKAGIYERLTVLSNHDPRFPAIFHHYRNKYKKSVVKDDDLVDAFSLCLTARLGNDNGFHFICDEECGSENGKKCPIATIKNTPSDVKN